MHYYLNAGACSPCTDAGNGCVECSLVSYAPAGITQDYVTCTKCLPGKYLDPLDTTSGIVVFNNQCKSCLTDCKLCTDGTTCNTCKKSYYLNTDKKSCQLCPAAISNCLTCHPTSIKASCLVCRPNSALQADPNESTRNICGACSVIDTNCI